MTQNKYEAEVIVAGGGIAGIVTAILSQPVRWKDEHNRAAGVAFDALELSPDAKAAYIAFADDTERGQAENGPGQGER